MLNKEPQTIEPSLCHDGERLDDLQLEGLRILQKPDAFRFGMDAVLLAHFAKLRPRDVVADMGTGTGVLPLLLSQLEPTATFHAFEWQLDMADMATRSVQINKLSERITIHAEDLRNAPVTLGRESINAIVCNPPYGKQGGVIPSQTVAHRLARHESECTLDEMIQTCARVLRNQGRLWMVFPAPRALELMDALRACRLEPKHICMVCAKASKPPYLVLVEAIKNAKPMLHWLPPLIVYHEDGIVTDEVKAIYAGKQFAY